MNRQRVALLAAVVLVVGVGSVGGVLAMQGATAEPAATVIEAGGDTTVHDPALVVGEEDEPWFVYSTGLESPVGSPGPVVVRRSVDQGATWEDLGPAWAATDLPDWVAEHVPEARNYWAPELYQHDGTWYLYYSVSTFGSNTSAIGLRTGSTLDPDDPDYGWTDQGMVWSSDLADMYNAIDAGILEDADGTPWMVFGSHWLGIQVVELTWPSGLAADPDAEPVQLAYRPDSPHQVEAPYVVEHDGWYYLLLSEDACCQGTDSTYRITVGRSQQVTGPYVTRDGTDLTENGGDTLLAGSGDLHGPGGQSVSQGVLAFHFYDGAHAGRQTLALRELAWDDEGWPVATTADEQEAARGQE